MSFDYRRLSKVLAHALRHKPWLYELELDEQGWTDVSAVLHALNTQPKWQQTGLNEEHLEHLMANQNKKRYEMAHGRIRALYGHSLQAKIIKTPAIPPHILYHGTAPATVPLILQNGLLPMRRQYVHLSADIPTAQQVGRRKAKQPILIHIHALKAHQAGHAFYKGNDLIWLADHIPPAYITNPTPENQS